MKHRKTTLTLALALTLATAMTLTACGDSTDEDKSSATPPLTSNESTNSTSADESTADTTSDESTDVTTSGESTGGETDATTDEKPDNTTEPDTTTDKEPDATTDKEPDATTDEADKPQQEPTPNKHVQKLIDITKGTVGKNFAAGECTLEKGFDNSGLIYYALTSIDYDCPRGLTGQKTLGTQNKNMKEILPGDILFFSNDTKDKDDTGFGGIYIGNNEMIFSPSPGQKVCIKNIDNSFYKEHFQFFIRLGLASA